jgi:hypothetical protein
MLNGGEFKTKKLYNASAALGLEKTKSLKSQTTKAGKTLLGASKATKYADFSYEEIDPPISVNVRLSGHSFAPGSQPFIPMIKMSTQKLQFSPCSPGESVYQIVQLNNTSDTPVQYKVLQDSSGTFKSFPSIGQIGGKSFTLVCFEFNPKSPRFYNF